MKKKKLRDPYANIIPELQLTSEQREALLKTFNDNQHLAGKPNNHDLRFLNNFKRSSLIYELNSKINPEYFGDSYYISNYGMERHSDIRRTGVISFEIQNIDNIPTTFYHNNEEVERYYGKDTLLLNTRNPHGAKTSTTERIFFQIVLSYRYSYEDYLKIYNSGNLII